MPASQTPAYDVDFWSDELILNPYRHYDAMRALGPAVWLSRNNAWALTRYLAKLEITVLLEALLRRVVRFIAANPQRRPHNTLRGLKSLDVHLIGNSQ
jgi:cytochrome P450